LKWLLSKKHIGIVFNLKYSASFSVLLQPLQDNNGNCSTKILDYYYICA